MAEKTWMNEIKISDMPNGDMRLVADLCGIEVAVTLMENLGGVNIYIPKMMERRLMRIYIQQHYTGSNAKEIALKLGKSIRFVYSLLAENSDGNGNNGNGQTSLFDDNPKK